MTVHYSRRVCDQCNTSECRMGDSGGRVSDDLFCKWGAVDIVKLQRIKDFWKDAELAEDEASRDYHTAKCALEQKGWIE